VPERFPAVLERFQPILGTPDQSFCGSGLYFCRFFPHCRSRISRFSGTPSPPAGRDGLHNFRHNYLRGSSYDDLRPAPVLDDPPGHADSPVAVVRLGRGRELRPVPLPDDDGEYVVWPRLIQIQEGRSPFRPRREPARHDHAANGSGLSHMPAGVGSGNRHLCWWAVCLTPPSGLAGRSSRFLPQATGRTVTRAKRARRLTLATFMVILLHARASQPCRQKEGGVLTDAPTQARGCLHRNAFSTPLAGRASKRCPVSEISTFRVGQQPKLREKISGVGQFSLVLPRISFWSDCNATPSAEAIRECPGRCGCPSRPPLPAKTKMARPGRSAV
jgi:hypothetical protein